MKIDILCSDVPAGVDGADIGRICPNLRDISYLDPNDDSSGKEKLPLKVMEMLPLKVIEVLPEAQMELLGFNWTSR